MVRRTPLICNLVFNFSEVSQNPGMTYAAKMANILKENLVPTPDWSSVKGCSMPYKMIKKNLPSHIIENGLKPKGTDYKKYPHPYGTYVTKPQPRISGLASMPSPYLDGLFDDLIKDCPYDLEATFETTRGCPYSCTYCEIGTKYYQKKS